MNNKPDEISKKSAGLWRAFVIGVCCAGAIGGTACVTSGLLSRPNPNAVPYYNTPVMTDSIFALARPDAALAKKIENDHAIAFLGKEHTFLLTRGGVELQHVAQGIDGDRMELDIPARALSIKGKIIWGTVRLRYVPPADAAQKTNDVAKLAELGFKADNTGTYYLSVLVNGLVCLPARFRKEEPAPFKKSRAIAFYHPADSSPPPDLGKIVGLPLTFVIDVALVTALTCGLVVYGIASI